MRRQGYFRGAAQPVQRRAHRAGQQQGIDRRLLAEHFAGNGQRKLDHFRLDQLEIPLLFNLELPQRFTD
jgi:hypothetical protein